MADEEGLLPLPGATLPTVVEEREDVDDDDDDDDDDDSLESEQEEDRDDLEPLPAPNLAYILIEDEMLREGLYALGWEDAHLNRNQLETLEEKFRAHYGANPHVIAQLWEDLITTKHRNARINPSKMPIKYFFVGLHFLKRYRTEIKRNTTWKISQNTLRSWSWYVVERIGALVHHKIRWPSDNYGDLIWIISVDGTHMRTIEPHAKDVPKDTSYFSFKHKCAGFNYEIGLSLHESKLIWFRGPYKAGTWNDVKIFKEKGLGAKLKSLGKMGIGDHGYRGYPKLISTNNSHDSEEVCRFKIRARQRHEQYNRKLKEFECLGQKVRHKKKQLVKCFRAVVVIVEYKMEMGEPLYII
jgi:hypothetical protein